MEDIILVTGYHRTRSWANAAFLESHTDAQVSFGVEVAHAHGPGMSIKWQFSPERARGAVLSWGPHGEVCYHAICESKWRLRQLWHDLASIRIYPRINAYLYEDSASPAPSGYYRSIL